MEGWSYMGTEQRYDAAGWMYMVEVWRGPQGAAAAVPRRSRLTALLGSC